MDFSTCPIDVKNFIQKVVELFKSKLEENCLSVVLHGSLAMGSYYPPKSDIDLLIIVERTIPANLKKELFQELLKLSNSRPTIGDLELSIVKMSELKAMQLEVPYELHFSFELKDHWESIPFDLTKKDGDLPAHIMVSYQRGVALFGQPLKQLINEPSWDLYKRSVGEDVKWILEKENILISPFYCILNLCRAHLLLNLNRKQVLSKEEGALRFLEVENNHNQIILKALSAYRDNKNLLEQQRRTNGEDWNQKELLEFRDFCLSLFENSIDLLYVD